MTQTEFVIHYIKTHGSINARQAHANGITRLAARIDDMKRKGHEVDSRWLEVPTRWGDKMTRVKEYYLVQRVAA